MFNRFAFFVVVALSFLLALHEVARAEGGCPPGFYPIGGQGVQGCAPIPSAGVGAEGPRATGRWQETWGAIALASNGASGVATGKVKKKDAISAAMMECLGAGASDCKVAFTYKNQCAAAATSKNGFAETTFGRAATTLLAEGIALDYCVSRGGRDCYVAYSACTEPNFKSY